MNYGEKTIENITLTGMVGWLNDNFNKKYDADFTVSDVQQYIRVGHLPNYLGGQKIEKVDNKYAKLYNVVST